MEDWQLDITRQKYLRQMPWLRKTGFASDEALLYLVTIERLQNCDYLMHLVDAYARARISRFQQYGMGSDLTIDEWCARQPHFKQLQSIRVDICNQKVQADLVAKRFVFSNMWTKNPKLS